MRNDRGWCSNRECPCWTRKSKRACHEFMGWRGTYRSKDKETWDARFCAFCAWERKDHRPLIRNGGKP